MIFTLLLPIFSTLSLAAPSTLLTRQTPSLPAGCTDQALSYPVDNFSFFNSTANLDCNNRPPGAQVCWRGDPFDRSSVCDPGTDASCVNTRPCPEGQNCATCTPVCITGVPDTPAGFGPPDEVRFTVPDWFSYGGDYNCYSKNPGNPGNIRTYAVGGGRVECGGVREAASFVGSSETEKGEIGFGKVRECQGMNWYFGYQVAFEMDCAFDSGRNATCSGPDELSAPLTMVVTV